MQHPAAALEAARLRLVRLAVDEKQSLQRVFARATRLIARTLDVERVGIWLFDAEHENLSCVCLYQRTTDAHGTGAILRLAEVPRYRRALEERRAVVAHDARTDPATAELTPQYLEPLGITAMLDATLFRHGDVAGVVCHEHVGSPRRWTDAEVTFAESVADLVALAMEQAAHIEARRALEQLTLRSEEDRRLAALGRVAAAVAHDFNNLLSIVQVRTEQVIGLDAVPAAAAEYARIVLDTVRRGRDLTRQLGEIGQPPDDAAESAVLDRVVAGAREMLCSLAPGGCTLTLHLRAAAARVPIDRAALERVLTNLVRNAFDASRKGDTVEVATVTAAGVDGAYAVLRVSDRGHGIDESTRQHMFEPYFTTRRTHGGSGLGLAIVHATVQRAGGFIEVESVPGQGTTVAVHLPATG